MLPRRRTEKRGDTQWEYRRPDRVHFTMSEEAYPGPDRFVAIPGMKRKRLRGDLEQSPQEAILQRVRTRLSQEERGSPLGERIVRFIDDISNGDGQQYFAEGSIEQPKKFFWYPTREVRA